MFIIFMNFGRAFLGCTNKFSEEEMVNVEISTSQWNLLPKNFVR